jgi:integrase
MWYSFFAVFGSRFDASSHLSTFFATMIAEERYDRANPVVSRIHSQRGAPAEARPYKDNDLAAIWECVVDSDRSELMLAFSIGEECGLRIGEVCNIRLSDIDQQAQTIYVRLPTKNKKPRTVPYHEKVKKYLAQWLAHPRHIPALLRCPSKTG